MIFRYYLIVFFSEFQYEENDYKMFLTLTIMQFKLMGKHI